mgnify:CR=1 FL=1
MMADLMDQHVTHDMPQRLGMFGPIIQDRPAVEKNHGLVPCARAAFMRGKIGSGKQSKDVELGLELEGQTTVEGPSVGSLIGLGDVRATLAMLRTPDGQGIELDKFHTPDAVRFGPVNAPVNTLGLRRIMFGVDDIDAVVARMQAHGAEIIGQMQYGESYRLAYIRGPEGIIVGLAEQLR